MYATDIKQKKREKRLNRGRDKYIEIDSQIDRERERERKRERDIKNQ